MYTVVPMKNIHLDQVEEIERLCFPDPWSRRLLDETLENAQMTNLAAVDGGGQVLGYASMQAVLDEGYLYNIAVRPDCRRQGVGGALLEALHRSAAEKNLAFLSLEVRRSNLGAQALYAQYGYRTAGVRKNYYERPKEDAIIMTLEFANGTETADGGGAEDRL